MTSLVVMTERAGVEHRRRVLVALRSAGLRPRPHTPTLLSVEAVPGVVEALVGRLPGVARVSEIPADHPRAARAARPGRRSVVRFGPVEIGADRGFAVISGPCAIESRDQLLGIARAVAAAGAHGLRGGLFKPRTSPYAFQGLGRRGLGIVAEVRERTGLPLVTEVTDVRVLGLLADRVDMIQIGARNMQNYVLLREAGRCGVPVLLKRGFGATVEETLLAAEHVLDGGNDAVIICERGIRTFERGYRFTLDLGAVPMLRERTHLPVIVDPSHAAGLARWVTPLALAAAAVGADGLIVESHGDPEAALCDGPQSLPTTALPELMSRLRLAVAAAGRSLAPPIAAPATAGPAAVAVAPPVGGTPDRPEVQAGKG